MELDDGLRWKIVDNTTGMVVHVSQINTQRISLSLNIFRTIKASSGDHRLAWFTNSQAQSKRLYNLHSSDDALIVRNIYIYSLSVYLWIVTKHSLCKCYHKNNFEQQVHHQE